MNLDKASILKGVTIGITEIGSLKTLEKEFKNTYFGVFYAIERQSLLRIASTKLPYTAIMALVRQNKTAGGKTDDFGNIFISPVHTNYKENEAALHNYFAENFEGMGKLYRLLLKDFIATLPTLDLEYRDETKEIEAKSQAVAETFKNLLFGRSL